MTTITGRHTRIPLPGRVPTNRTQAHHTDTPDPAFPDSLLPCARCTPERYASTGAKHRSDRS
jgi:hypothetical protein